MQTLKLEELTNFIESRKAEVESKTLAKGRERSFRLSLLDSEYGITILAAINFLLKVEL
ncbi:MAG: hypothetical protein IPL26_24170 [Leptospiraceae bacterium]|nr:hypothetical protein [Leptospiraceae bacterium]